MPSLGHNHSPFRRITPSLNHGRSPSPFSYPIPPQTAPPLLIEPPRNPVRCQIRLGFHPIESSSRYLPGSPQPPLLVPFVATHLYPPKMSSPIYRSASRAVRSLVSASKASRFSSEGRAVATASALSLYGNLPSITSNYRLAGSKNASRGWLSGVLGLTAAAYMLQEQEAYAAELERTFIAIKPDGVQRGLISEIISRFERKGFKLVAIKIVVPSKEFAQKHYHDLKERPFFDGLCDFLSSGPVVAMVWEGEGVIRYGRKLIGATDPQKSEPGTIRGDLAVVVGRNIIHGSDGPETSNDEINLWFKAEELVNYTSNAEKWIYGVN